MENCAESILDRTHDNNTNLSKIETEVVTSCSPATETGCEIRPEDNNQSETYSQEVTPETTERESPHSEEVAEILNQANGNIEPDVENLSEDESAKENNLTENIHETANPDNSRCGEVSDTTMSQPWELQGFDASQGAGQQVKMFNPTQFNPMDQPQIPQSQQNGSIGTQNAPVQDGSSPQHLDNSWNNAWNQWPQNYNQQPVDPNMPYSGQEQHFQDQGQAQGPGSEGPYPPHYDINQQNSWDPNVQGYGQYQNQIPADQNMGATNQWAGYDYGQTGQTQPHGPTMNEHYTAPPGQYGQQNYYPDYHGNQQEGQAHVGECHNLPGGTSGVNYSEGGGGMSAFFQNDVGVQDSENHSNVSQGGGNTDSVHVSSGQVAPMVDVPLADTELNSNNNQAMTASEPNQESHMLASNSFSKLPHIPSPFDDISAGETSEEPPSGQGQSLNAPLSHSRQSSFGQNPVKFIIGSEPNSGSNSASQSPFPTSRPSPADTPPQPVHQPVHQPSPLASHPAPGSHPPVDHDHLSSRVHGHPADALPVHPTTNKQEGNPGILPQSTASGTAQHVETPDQSQGLPPYGQFPQEHAGNWQVHSSPPGQSPGTGVPQSVSGLPGQNTMHSPVSAPANMPGVGHHGASPQANSPPGLPGHQPHSQQHQSPVGPPGFASPPRPVRTLSLEDEVPSNQPSSLPSQMSGKARPSSQASSASADMPPIPDNLESPPAAPPAGVGSHGDNPFRRPGSTPRNFPKQTTPTTPQSPRSRHSSASSPFSAQPLQRMPSRDKDGTVGAAAQQLRTPEEAQPAQSLPSPGSSQRTRTASGDHELNIYSNPIQAHPGGPFQPPLRSPPSGVPPVHPTNVFQPVPSAAHSEAQHTPLHSNTPQTNPAGEAAGTLPGFSQEGASGAPVGPPNQVQNVDGLPAASQQLPGGPLVSPQRIPTDAANIGHSGASMPSPKDVSSGPQQSKEQSDRLENNLSPAATLWQNPEPKRTPVHLAPAAAPSPVPMMPLGKPLDVHNIQEHIQEEISHMPLSPTHSAKNHPAQPGPAIEKHIPAQPQVVCPVSSGHNQPVNMPNQQNRTKYPDQFVPQHQNQVAPQQVGHVTAPTQQQSAPSQSQAPMAQVVSSPDAPVHPSSSHPGQGANILQQDPRQVQQQPSYSSGHGPTGGTQALSQLPPGPSDQPPPGGLGPRDDPVQNRGPLPQHHLERIGSHSSSSSITGEVTFDDPNKQRNSREISQTKDQDNRKKKKVPTATLR